MSDASAKDEKKSDARSGRLSMRKTNEEVFRRKYLAECRQECNSFFKDFADCAKENGLLVVVRCRVQNRAMSDCMDVCNTEEKFQAHLQSKLN